MKYELSALHFKQSIAAGEEYAVPNLAQLWTVTSRNFEQDWRVPSYLYSNIMSSTDTASFFSSLHILPWTLIHW